MPDFGEISVTVKDMHPVYEAAKQLRRTFYVTEDVSLTLATDIPMPIEHVWNYANQSEFRNLIIGSDRYEVLDRKEGRVAAGSTYQCYHGRMIVTQLVLDWLPFDRVVLQQLIPMPGRRPTQTIIDLQFEQIDEGTRLSQTATKPTGPLFQRSLAKMMMTARRGRAQADMDEFRERIVEDYKAYRQHQETDRGFLSSRIEAATSASFEDNQAGPDG